MRSIALLLSLALALLVPTHASACNGCGLNSSSCYVCSPAGATSNSCIVFGSGSGCGTGCSIGSVQDCNSGSVGVGMKLILRYFAGTVTGVQLGGITPMSVGDVVGDLASELGVSTSALQVQAGGLIVGPSDEWATHGIGTGFTAGVALAGGVDNGDFEARFCSFAGTTVTSLGSATLEDGQWAAAPFAIGSNQYLLLVHYNVFTEEEWETDYLDIHQSVLADIQSNVGTALSVTGTTPPGPCN